MGKQQKVDEKLLPTTTLSKVVGTLEKWLSSQDSEERLRLAHAFEELVGDHQIEGLSQKIEDTLLNLCIDCAYYSENPKHLSEDPALLSHEKFKAIVLKALNQIGSS